MPKLVKISFLALVSISIAAEPAAAYVGPGMGAGAIAVVFGVIGSIFLVIFALLYYPIKRLIRGRKTTKAKPAEKTDK